MGRGSRTTSSSGPSATRRDRAGLGASEQAALRAFEASDPRLSVWRRWPHVSDAENEMTDRWACGEVSRQAARFLADRDLDVVVVHAEGCHHPMADEHYWVRLRRPGRPDVNLDWTARQFYDLEYPALPEHQDLPFPLVWEADDNHPVAGGYDSVTELPSP